MKKVILSIIIFSLTAMLFSQEIIFTSYSGKVSRYLKDRIILDEKGKILGSILEDEIIKSEKGSILGQILNLNDPAKNAEIRSSRNRIKGIVTPDGVIKSEKDSIKGYIQNDGSIHNFRGKIIAYAKPFNNSIEMKKLIGAIYYFFIRTD